MKDLSHEEAFDWIEDHHAQVWWDRKTNKWTVQVRFVDPDYFDQQEAYGLVVAVTLIAERVYEWKTSSKTF